MYFWTLRVHWILVVFLLWFDTFTPSERVALAAAFLVLIGVAGEYAIEAPLIEKRRPFRNVVKRLSMGLLLLGLAGDTLGVVMGQAEMAALTREAGGAKQSAVHAAEAASRAETSADNLQRQLLGQGPRENLLGGACSFVNAVKPFAGQKIQIRTDLPGISDPADVEETRNFVSSIEFLLGQISKWSVSEAHGENGWGITVAVRRNSSLRTKEAASALASAFGNCGLTDMQGNRPVSNVADVGTTFDRENGPPDTIVLFVGRHPR